MSGSWTSSRARSPADLAGVRPVGRRRHRDVAVRAVPGRDPVSPPQLAGDVPVPDVGHPVFPRLLEPRRQDRRLARAGRLERGVGERLRADEPLGLEPRLHDVVAPLAATDDHLVGLLAGEVAARLERRHDPGPRLVPVEAVELGARARDARLVVEDRRGREAVAKTRLVVVVVVGGRDLHRTGAERRVHDRVRDDRHVALDERDADAPSDQRGIARVVGMDRDGGVAEDRLGPGGGDRDRRAGIRLARALVDEVVAHPPQRAGLGGGDHLEVADARLAARAPVDQRLGAVGEIVPVQPLERDPDRLGADLVHRVAQASPVAAAAEAPLLHEDDLAGLGDEGLHPREVPLAPEARAALAFLGEDPVEHELGGDARVVEPGQEQRRVADHPGVTHHQVLDGGPLGMPEVEAARDVGRRLDDHERRQRRVGGGARAVRREDVGREPALVDVELELGGDVGARELGLRGPPALRLRHRSGSRKTQKPRRPADERGRGTTCWFDAGACRSSRPDVDPASSRRGIGRHPHGSRATFASIVPARLAPSRARSVADPDLLFSVVAVRAGVYHAGIRAQRTRRSNPTVDPRAMMSDVGACVPSPETRWTEH